MQNPRCVVVYEVGWNSHFDVYICKKQTHFFHFCIYERQRMQLVGATFGHNYLNVCIGIIYSIEFPY
jgi:hypothetical protein